MRTGYASVELSVPPGTAMGGYADRTGGAHGHLEPLEVAALTWHDGTHRVALAIADVICVNRDVTAQARQLLPEMDVVIVAATHTHAGPETGCRPGGGPTPQPWRDRLARAVTDAVRAALASERATEASIHQGQLRDVGARRDLLAPEPVVPLDVVAVRDPAGGLTGVLAVLPVHPTVLPATNRLVSPDLPGAVRKALRHRIGAGPWLVVATGAAGDVSTRHTRQGQDNGELDRLGTLVADRCLELLAGTGTPAWAALERSGILSWRARDLEVPCRTKGADPGLLATAQAEYRAAAARGDNIAARIAQTRLHGARLIAVGGLAADPVYIEVNALRIGALNLVTLPGEPFLDTASRLRAATSGPAVTLGYANGYPGYLPFADAFAAGGYEALAAVVAPGATEQIIDTAAGLLTALDHEESEHND